MKNQFVSLLLISSISIFNSCGRKLEKDEAKEVILKKIKFPQVMTNKLQHGEVCYCVNFGGTDISPEKKLTSQNLITFQYQGNKGGNMFNPMTYACYYLELTEEGKKYDNGGGWTDKDGRHYYNMRVAEKVFGEVTDLHEIKVNGERAYIVEYTWKYVNITPFQEYCHKRNSNSTSYSDGQTFQETVKMVYYDGTGWRIEN
jgi:hypothetical protein